MITLVCHIHTPTRSHTSEQTPFPRRVVPIFSLHPSHRIVLTLFKALVHIHTHAIMSSGHHHHHHLERPSARRARKTAEGQRAELDRLLDPSYASLSHSSLKKSLIEPSTYFDSSGQAHDANYNPYSGLEAPRRGYAFHDRASSTSSEADFGGLDTLSGVLQTGRPTSYRANNRKPINTGRKWNQPASEMYLIPPRLDIASSDKDDSPSPTSPHTPSSHGYQPYRQPSIATSTSTTRYPNTATTTVGTKSRRSTLLSQSTVHTFDSDDILPPPGPRFGYDTRQSMRGGYPSPPSSIASSSGPQIYPETPAQAASRRKSLEQSRPFRAPAAVIPSPPPLSSILPRPNAHELTYSTLQTIPGGSVTGGESFKYGVGSTYVPTKWSEERKGRRGGIEEEFRPTEKDSEWTPGCADNVKRSWHEATSAFRFSLFRTKKKLARKTGQA
ncbi:hypothetical protein [Phaffia rhodozyma]|uniref:Uncharacterized protein n=1 Tax=Phaffia rhodozyma TaxID=264483 RepID=A0A0F7STD4_PHARH|nr:hypothetical protein [Phaffia rhodozyma]